MKQKRSNMEVRCVNGLFEVKSIEKGKGDKKPMRKIKIRGYANRAERDRVKELISPEAWDLDNFMKNPVVLVNHGHDPEFGNLPVGQVTTIKISDKGLFVEAEILDIKDHAPTQKLISLIENGIVRCFSVGFMPLDETETEEGKDITKAELYEVSVVGIPMQQDSIFEVTGKMLKTKDIEEIKKEVERKKEVFSLVEKYVEEGKTEDQAVQQAVIDIMEKDDTFKPDKKYYADIFKFLESKQTEEIDESKREIPAAKDDKENNEGVTPQLELMQQMTELHKRQVMLLEAILAQLEKGKDEQMPEEQPQEPMSEESIDEEEKQTGGTMIPSDEMSREELRSALQERANEFGIEITDDAKLTFPADGPKSLEQYGDPVNLKFPVDSAERAQNARVRFKQFADEIYDSRDSKKIVHNRIVRAELGFGIKPGYDPEDALDKLLDQDVVEAIMAADEEEKTLNGLDVLEKSIENLTKRLENLV